MRSLGVRERFHLGFVLDYEGSFPNLNKHRYRSTWKYVEQPASRLQVSQTMQSSDNTRNPVRTMMLRPNSHPKTHTLNFLHLTPTYNQSPLWFLFVATL